MKPENFATEMNQVLATWGKPSQVDAAVSAIRAIENITCDQLRDIFNVIASKMTAADFSTVDMDAIDELSGFICGEAEAEMPTFCQCAEEGARQQFAARVEAV